MLARVLDFACPKYGSFAKLLNLPAISSGDSTKSTTPAAIALRGMEAERADSGRWAKVIPPAALIASKPTVPSEAVPDKTTPIA